MAIERIQLRRGTTAEWTAANPILSFGEPGVEVKTDSTLSLKIGDGSATWSSLPYYGETGETYVTSAELAIALASYSTTIETNSAISTAVSAGIANVVDSAPATLDTLNEIAAALGDDPNFATTILNELSNKSDTGHTHTTSDITNFGSYIELTDISVTTNAASGNGSLSYDNTSGVFTFTPALAFPTLKTVTASTYSTIASDAGNIINANSASAIAITVNDVLNPGESIAVYRRGAGAVTFTAGAGVTIEGAGTSGADLKITNTYTTAAILCIAQGEYAIFGDVDPA